MPPRFEDNLNDTTLKKSILRGEIIYLQYCINCHKVNGNGGLNIPPLQNSDFLMTKRSESIRAIKYGQIGEIYVNNKKWEKRLSENAGNGFQIGCKCDQSLNSSRHPGINV